MQHRTLPCSARLSPFAAALGFWALSSTAFAQNDPAPTPGPTLTGSTIMAPTVGNTDTQQYPRFGRNLEHSVGFRVWVYNIPAWEVGLFVHIEPGWAGPLSIAAGPEYVYRKGNLDVILSLQYTGMQTDAGYMRGRNESDRALERVESRLWGLYANALFLWGTRFNDWFELQYGAGVGLGYIGGDLFRTQVNDDAAHTECRSPGTSSFCDNANNHYAQFDSSGNVTSRFSEASLFNNGSVPPLLPWISLPHVALHFRPHRYVDVRLDGGWSIIGFYGGLATHFVF